MGKTLLANAINLDYTTQKGFFMVSKRDAAIGIINGLTQSDYHIWHLLLSLNPFADTTPDGEPIFVNIPSPADIGVALGIHTKTVQKSMRKLQKLGLYTYRITSWEGYNLTAANVKEMLRENASNNPQTHTGQDLEGFYSQKEQNYPSREQNYSRKEQKCSRKKARIFTGKGFQDSLQTIHTKQTLPPTPQGGKEGERGIDLIEVEVVNQLTTPLSTQNGLSSQAIDLNEDKCTPACSIVVAENTTQQSSTAISTVDPFYRNKGRSPQYITDNLPDGPWKTEKGRFDPAFIEWMASKWVTRYGGTLEDKKSDVWLHFRNKPDAIAVHWEAYYNTTQKAVENVKTRLEHGFDIKPEEQQKVVQNSRVLMNPLPEDLKPVDELATPELRAVGTLAPSISETEIRILAPVAEPEPERKPIRPELFDQARKQLLNRQQQGSNHPNEETPWMDNGTVNKGFFVWLVQEFGGSGAAQSRAFTFIRHESAEMVKPYWERFIGQDAEPVKESAKPVITNVNKAIAAIGTRIERTLVETESELQQLQRALNDPMLHRQTLSLFRRPGRISTSYECDFDGTQWLVCCV